MAATILKFYGDDTPPVGYATVPREITRRKDISPADAQDSHGYCGIMLG